MSVKDTMAAALDLKVRNAGWHFMWLVDAYVHFGVGRSAASAIERAIIRVLDRLKDRYMVNKQMLHPADTFNAIWRIHSF
jgi:hypothetical protein